MSVQRSAKKNSQLSVDRVRRLEAIGFTWEKRKAAWDEMFEALRTFKEKQGNCNVTRQSPENSLLGTWVVKQRRMKTIGRLSPDRIQRLETLGFIWDLSKAAWGEMYEALHIFKKKFGHCHVPNTYLENPALSKWVFNQRIRKRRASIDAGQIRQLEDLGFVWEPYDAAWDEMYNVLSAFKEDRGHCNVTCQHQDSLALGRWVNRQRGAMKGGRLSVERGRRLEDLGFAWDPFEAAWEEMYTALRTFKKKNGHCNVPQQFPENQILANWIGNIRQMKKHGRLATDRVRQLDVLGFMWDPLEAAWEVQYEILRTFKEEYGHCNVPQRYPEDPALGRWLNRQKGMKKRGRLSAERIRRLEKIGIRWSIRSNVKKMHRT